jgi:hypothetical protein
VTRNMNGMTSEIFHITYNSVSIRASLDGKTGDRKQGLCFAASCGSDADLSNGPLRVITANLSRISLILSTWLQASSTSLVQAGVAELERLAAPLFEVRRLHLTMLRLFAKWRSLSCESRCLHTEDGRLPQHARQVVPRNEGRCPLYAYS